MKRVSHPWTSIDSFEIDRSIFPRAFLNRDAVKRYAMVYRNNEQGMPPVTLGRLPDGRIILIDGFHRCEAAKLASITRLRAETVETTVEIARWLAVDANIRNGVPIPQREKRKVFRRFIEAGQNRRKDGELASSREIARTLPIASHTTILEWMRRDFPKIYAEMVGDDPEDVEEEQIDDAQRMRDQALGNVEWAEQQLVTALVKAREHAPTEELAGSLRWAIRDFERALGRPMVTLEEGLDAIHHREQDEDF